MVKYFAYGSNMSPTRLMERDIKYSNRQKGILRGYKFTINKKSFKNPNIGFANITEDDNSIVEGVLYDVEEGELLKLDKFEGSPKHYHRKMVYIDVGGFYHESITYIACSNWVSPEPLPTSQEYKNKILEGKDLLSDDYYNFLKENIFLTENIS